MKPTVKPIKRTSSYEWVAGDYTHRAPSSWLPVLACVGLLAISALAGLAFWWADSRWGLQ